MRRIVFFTLALGVFGLAAQAADFTESVGILRSYQDHDEKEVIRAIEQLAALQDKRAIGPLGEMLDLGPNRVRLVTAARQALIELGAMEVLGQKLRTGSLQDRQETAQVLSHMGSPAIDLLEPLLQDTHPELRNTVVISLGILAQATGDAKAVEALLKAVSDESPYVRESAVLALGNLSSSSAIQALVGLLKAGQLVPQAGAALERIAKTGEASAELVVDALAALLKEQDLGLVERGISALRNLAVPQAKKPLLSALGHPSARVRFAAVHGLVPYQQDPDARAAVEALSKTETDTLVRGTAGSFLAGQLNIDQ